MYGTTPQNQILLYYLLVSLFQLNGLALMTMGVANCKNNSLLFNYLNLVILIYPLLDLELFLIFIMIIYLYSLKFRYSINLDFIHH